MFLDLAYLVFLNRLVTTLSASHRKSRKFALSLVSRNVLSFEDKAFDEIAYAQLLRDSTMDGVGDGRVMEAQKVLELLHANYTWKRKNYCKC